MGFDVYDVTQQTLEDTSEDLAEDTEESTMSCSCTCGCCTTCCPEPVAVTLNQTVIELGDEEGLFRQEVLTFAALTATLSASPILTAAFKLYINGVLQQLGVDYWLNDTTVTLAAEPPSDSVCIASYFSSDTYAASSVPIGTIMAHAGGAIPTGWLLTDGDAISQATYSDLFTIIGHTFAADAADEAALDLAGDFRLPNYTVPMYDGATFVSVTGIIRYQ